MSFLCVRKTSPNSNGYNSVNERSDKFCGVDRKNVIKQPNAVSENEKN